MKIGIFTCEYLPFPGGIATYCFELATSALRLGHEPVIYTFAQGGKPHPEPANFPVVRLQPQPPGYKHYHLPEMAYRMHQTVRRDRLDLAYPADMQCVIAFGMTPRSSQRRAGVHGTDVMAKPMTMLARFTPYKPMKSYDHVVANSDFTRGLTLEHHPYLRQDQVISAPLGVDGFWGEPVSQPDIDAVSTKYRIPAGNTVLISIGRLERRKGVLKSVEALADVAAAKRGVTYLIIGRQIDEAYTQAVAQAAESSGVDIRLLGSIPRDDIRALCHRATSLVHAATRIPEKAEGFGLVIMEAAAAGLPAVVTDVDALPEVVRDGVTGFVVPDGDRPALADRLERVIVDPGSVAALESGCVEWSRAFTWDGCARKAFGI